MRVPWSVFVRCTQVVFRDESSCTLQSAVTHEFCNLLRRPLFYSMIIHIWLYSANFDTVCPSINSSRVYIARVLTVRRFSSVIYMTKRQSGMLVRRAGRKTASRKWTKIAILWWEDMATFGLWIRILIAWNSTKFVSHFNRFALWIYKICFTLMMNYWFFL